MLGTPGEDNLATCFLSKDSGFLLVKMSDLLRTRVGQSGARPPPALLDLEVRHVSAEPWWQSREELKRSPVSSSSSELPGEPVKTPSSQPNPQDSDLRGFGCSLNIRTSSPLPRVPQTGSDTFLEFSYFRLQRKHSIIPHPTASFSAT